MIEFSSVRKLDVVQDGIQKMMNFEPDLTNKEYDFHKIKCINSDKNPFDNKEYFYIRGRSSSDSVKYQCKHCKKITNVLPDNIDFAKYYQQQRDYLQEMLQMIINRLTMNEICSRLKISHKTYYHKIELISNQCSQFQIKHEDNYFRNRKLDNLYVNSNVYGSGKANQKWKMIASCDFLTGYIYRNDIEVGEKNNYDFYTSTGIPHYLMLSRNKNPDRWFFLTPNKILFDETIRKSMESKQVSTFFDEKDDLLIKYLNYLKKNIKRFNSPYIHYYANIFKVVYNFTISSCQKDTPQVTPAQMMNLTEKKYEVKELLSEN